MKVTRERVLLEIDKFLSGRGGAYDWDDFTTLPIDDPSLDAVRKICADLPELYPPAEPRQYCGPEGLSRLRRIARELRQRKP